MPRSMEGTRTQPWSHTTPLGALSLVGPAPGAVFTSPEIHPVFSVPPWSITNVLLGWVGRKRGRKETFT